MIEVNNIEINAAFYELYENVFKDDFFVILTALRPSNRIKALRERASVLFKEEVDGETKEKKIIDMTKLDEDEQNELMSYNIKAGATLKKVTPRIAYVGSLLHDKKYRGSYDEFMAFLSNHDISEFMKPEIQKKIWEKITLDQATPESVKNA